MISLIKKIHKYLNFHLNLKRIIIEQPAFIVRIYKVFNVIIIIICQLVITKKVNKFTIR